MDDEAWRRELNVWAGVFEAERSMKSAKWASITWIAMNRVDGFLTMVFWVWTIRSIEQECPNVDIGD